MELSVPTLCNQGGWWTPWSNPILPRLVNAALLIFLHLPIANWVILCLICTAYQLFFFILNLNNMIKKPCLQQHNFLNKFVKYVTRVFLGLNYNYRRMKEWAYLYDIFFWIYKIHNRQTFLKFHVLSTCLKLMPWSSLLRVGCQSLSLGRMLLSNQRSWIEYGLFNNCWIFKQISSQ